VTITVAERVGPAGSVLEWIERHGVNAVETNVLYAVARRAPDRVA
jgi:hypothetical protein